MQDGVINKKILSDLEKEIKRWVETNQVSPEVLRIYEFHRIADALEDIARKLQGDKYDYGG